MKRLAIVSAGLAALAAGYLFTGSDTKLVQAADHRDSPSNAMAADAPTDILDLFAWVNDNDEDPNSLVLVMTMHSGATDAGDFDDTADYTFHLTTSNADGSSTEDHELVCNFAEGVDCTLTTGATEIHSFTGATNNVITDGNAQLFAGTADDPFFFNATGFTETIGLVTAAAGDLDFVDDCPQVPGSVAATLVQCLSTDCDLEAEDGPGDAENAFDGDVLAIVVEIPVTSINTVGSGLQVWASTSNEGGQLDRAGRPAISTALIGTFDPTNGGDLKDDYNADDARSGWGAAFAGDIAGALGIYDSLDSTLPDPS